MIVDWSISLGNVLTACSTISGVFLLIRRITRLEMKVDLVWSWFKKEHNINNGG